jgi:predicted NAD/FAD-binding protein
MTARRIAVVGSGIAGLSAAWLLAPRHHVTLYEANDYPGGHTHTVDVTLDGVTAPVDTGFLVYNERTYPELSALFNHLGVRSVASDMSFSVRIEGEGLEWAGGNLAGLFARKRNLVRPRFWVMLRDILRFNREAMARAEDVPAELTLAAYLEAGKYGRELRDWYLLPMSGAIWSCPTARMLEYPARTFLRFCRNHGLLQIADRPQWRTLLGGGRDYVNRMLCALRDVRLKRPVVSVSRHAHGVAVTDHEGRTARYDEAVLACHSDQALNMLADADIAERRVLSALRYQSNRAVLHTDLRFLPRARSAWSAWNYHSAGSEAGETPVGVSYLINRLQPLPFTRPVIVTLNPHEPPAEDAVIAQFDYDHPIFDCASISAQQALPTIQGRRRTWFCGAWAGYGFHEDGLRAGMNVATALGASIPWRAGAVSSMPRMARAAA